MPSVPRRIFLSYTGEDLARHAAVAFEVVAGDFQWTLVRDVHWAPEATPSLEVCCREVKGCDLVILLLAWRHGSIPTDGDGARSFVEYELEAAHQAGIPVIPFLVGSTGSWPMEHVQQLTDPAGGERLRLLKERLTPTLHGRFTEDPESLRAPLFKALRAIEQAAPTPVPTAPSSPLATRQRAAVAEACRHLRLIGFGEQLQVRLPIGDAWVPLQVVVSRAFAHADLGTADLDRLERSGPIERDLRVEDLFRIACERDRRGVALLGEPGAGKTPPRACSRGSWPIPSKGPPPSASRTACFPSSSACAGWSRRARSGPSCSPRSRIGARPCGSGAASFGSSTGWTRWPTWPPATG